MSRNSPDQSFDSITNYLINLLTTVFSVFYCLPYLYFSALSCVNYLNNWGNNVLSLLLELDFAVGKSVGFETLIAIRKLIYE